VRCFTCVFVWLFCASVSLWLLLCMAARLCPPRSFACRAPPPLCVTSSGVHVLPSVYGATGDNQLFTPEVYMMAFGLAGCVVMQLKFLNKGLTKAGASPRRAASCVPSLLSHTAVGCCVAADALLVVPIYQVFWVRARKCRVRPRRSPTPSATLTHCCIAAALCTNRC
jgi:hypothetical protein